MARRGTLARRITLGVLAATFVPPALAQPAPAREPAANAPPSLEATVDSIRSAYRGAPIAERIVVRVRTPGEGERRASILLRWSWGRDATSSAARLELGSLLVSATPERLVAIHRQEPGTCFVGEPAPPAQPGEGASGLPALLRRHLPPTPLPQLALGDPGLDLYPPFLGVVRWDRVEAPDPRTLRLSGVAGRPDGSGSPVIATLDRRTHRLRSMSLAPGEGVDLELTIAALEPGEPSTWAISPDARRTVASLAQLVTARTSAGAGDRLATISALTHALQPWTPQDSFRELAQDNAVGVLLLFRASPDLSASPARDDVLAAQRALGELAPRPAPGEQRPTDRPGTPPFFGKALAVFGPDKLDLSTLPDQAERWTQGMDSAGRPLWLIDALPLLDSLAPQAQAVLVVIDRRQRLISRVVIDALAEDPDPVARVRAALLGRPEE